MFPDRREPLEIEAGDLMIGGIAGLFGSGIDCGSFDRPPPRRKNLARGFFVHDPQNLIHPMDSPVAQCSIGIIQKIPKTFGVDDWTIRTQRTRSAPHVPVESLVGVLIFSRLFLVASIMDEGANHPNLSRFS